MILRSVRLVDGSGPVGEPVDVRVDGGVIAEIALHLEDDAVESIDGDGRWLIPGLWDHHVHFGQWALARDRVDLASASSAAEAVAFVAADLRSGLTVGTGFRDAIWPVAPTADDLDALSSPVVLISGDVHTTWANRAALALLGRPAADWWLREQDAFDLVGDVDRVAGEDLEPLVAAAARDAAARGVVGIVDLEMGGTVDRWRHRVTAGLDLLRVEAGVYPVDLGGEVFPTGTALHDLLTVGPYKLFADGSLNTRTAHCAHPYPDGSTGIAVHPGPDLLAAARQGVERGLVPAIHAIGDAAVTRALDVFEELGTGGRLEHAQLVDPADLPRFAALGIEASVQPAHLLDDVPVAEAFWAGRTDRAYAWGSLHRAGARLLLGSDAPVAPLDPWRTLAAAVDRDWHPEQSLPAHVALDVSTRGARLQVGAVADLVLCDDDPLDPQRLRGMTTSGTWLAGRSTLA